MMMMMMMEQNSLGVSAFFLFRVFVSFLSLSLFERALASEGRTTRNAGARKSLSLTLTHARRERDSLQASALFLIVVVAVAFNHRILVNYFERGELEKDPNLHSHAAIYYY